MQNAMMKRKKNICTFILRIYECLCKHPPFFYNNSTERSQLLLHTHSPLFAPTNKNISLKETMKERERETKKQRFLVSAPPVPPEATLNNPSTACKKHLSLLSVSTKA